VSRIGVVDSLFHAARPRLSCSTPPPERPGIPVVCDRHGTDPPLSNWNQRSLSPVPPSVNSVNGETIVSSSLRRGVTT